MLTIWSVLHLRTHRNFLYPLFVSNVLNANHRSTGIEGKNVLGKDYIKLVVPLNTFFIAHALVKYIGMCGPKGYGFSSVLVIERVSILADFGHFGHK